MQVILDSGPLYAAFDLSDRHHEGALRFLHQSEIGFITNLLVVAEVAFLLRHSPSNRAKFLKWIAANTEIDAMTAADLPRIIVILEKYNDLRPDLADASLVALSERIGTRRIATLDKDFDVYRMRRNQPFENVFPRR